MNTDETTNYGSDTIHQSIDTSKCPHKVKESLDLYALWLRKEMEKLVNVTPVDKK